MPEARSKFSLDFSEAEVLFQVMVLRILAEPIPIPAPSRTAFEDAVLATPTTKSANSTVVELTKNCEPSTYRSPLILTNPVLSPTPAGSIVNSEGPVIVLVLIPIAEPVAPVLNWAAVTIPEATTLVNEISSARSIYAEP